MLTGTNSFNISPSQKRTWQLHRQGYALNTLLHATVSKQLTKEAWVNIFTNVIARHESLRTFFELPKNRLFPFQVIQETVIPEITGHHFDKNDPGDMQALVREKLAATRDAGTTGLLDITLVNDSNNIQHLLLTAPALIADALSLVNILQEINSGWNADVVTTAPLQFIQYSEWQRELVSQPAEEAQRFWETRNVDGYLKEELSLQSMQLPQESSGHSFFEWEADALLQQQVEEKTAELEVDRAVVLFACWAVVVYQYLSEKEDVVMGEASSERSFDAFSSIIGPLAKVLPMHIKLHPHLTFRELCNAIASEREMVKMWQDNFVWNAAAAVSGNEEYPSRMPVHFEQLPWNTALPGDLCKLETIYSHTDLCHLKLSFAAVPGMLKFRLSFLSRLFSPAAIQQISRRFDAVLTNALDNSTIKMADLAVANEGETAALLQLNKTMVPYAAGSIVEIFEAQVLKTPDHKALTYLEKEYTFQQLDTAANMFAARLQQQFGNIRDRIVACRLNRSDKSIIAILGILKCGAAYLPVDIHTPPGRIKFILEDSHAVTIISDQMIEGLPAEQVWLFTDDQPESLLQPAPKVFVPAGNTAYVIYTSGSTGVPKGVLVTHQSLCNYVNWFNTTHHITEQHSTLLLSSVAFDLCYTSLWTSLTSGACLHVLEEAPAFDGEAVWKTLSEKRVTYIKLTPSHFNVLVNSLSFEERVAEGSLQLIVLGGEEINIRDVERLRAEKPDITLVNHYGPTETTIGTIACTIGNEDWSWFKKRPVIGKPIFNNRVFVLDKERRLVPPGVIGEICIAGHGVSAGYLNREALTADKFITHACADGGILYCTGDLGRWTADEQIQFFGRHDFQVKVRGYRIELAEIEHALLGLDVILDASVIVDRQSENIRIKAFYLGPVEIAETKIRTHLKTYLPDYMLPDEYIRLEAFPLTPNGKKDYKALALIRKEAAHRYCKPPQNMTQSRLLTIWKEVLEKEHIGIDDDFLELGGHSLKAVQIVAKVYKTLNVKIELKDLFNLRSIAELSALIAGREQISYDAIRPVEEQDYYDLSHAQKRLWIIDQLSNGGVVYNIPEIHRFKGKLDLPALENTFCTLITRHESLRTFFKVVNGTPKQKVVLPEEVDFSMAYTDLRQHVNRELLATQLANEEAIRPFVLTKAPLIRVAVIQLEEEEYLFLFIIHHIISDAWSSEILMEEIATLYGTGNSQKELTPLLVQYKDYTVWQNKQLAGNAAESHKAFWLEQFKQEIPCLHLPTDFPRPAVKTYNGDTIHSILTAGQAAGLTKLATASNASLFMVLMAMVNALLYRYTGDEDIVIGCPVAGRQHPDLERQVGFYLNNLALRTRISRDDTFNSLLAKVKTGALQAYEHEIYPFDLLVDALGIARDQSRSPLFDVVVMLRNIEVTDHDSTQLSGITLGSFQVAYKVSTIDLRLVFCERGDNIVFSIDYNTDLFKRSSIEQFVQHFIEMVDHTLKCRDIGITAYVIGENTVRKEEELITRFNF